MVGSMVDPQNLQQRFSLNYESESYRQILGSYPLCYQEDY